MYDLSKVSQFLKIVLISKKEGGDVNSVFFKSKGKQRGEKSLSL